MRVQILNLNFGVKDGLKLNQELKRNIVGLHRSGNTLYKSCTVNLESIKTTYKGTTEFYNYLLVLLLQLVDKQHNLVQIKT